MLLLALQEHVSEVLQSEDHAPSLLLGNLFALLLCLKQVNLFSSLHLLSRLSMACPLQLDLGLAGRFRQEESQRLQQLTLLELMAGDLTGHNLSNPFKNLPCIGQSLWCQL